jgi:integrase
MVKEAFQVGSECLRMPQQMTGCRSSTMRFWELYPLTERAGVSHVEVADWATLQGQIYGVADDDQLQETIVEAKVSAQRDSCIQSKSISHLDDAGKHNLIIRCMADIQPEKIEWLWPGRIAIGKQTLIGGEPGLGKFQITAALAAAVTTGGPWPCNEGRAPLGSALILSAEDDASDTIQPRLDAAGANVQRVHLIPAVRQADGSGRRTFNLQTDLALLEDAIARIGDVRLVIIDPVSSYLGKTDSHKNADVRGTLEPLGDMASRLRVAVISITHFSRGVGQSAVNSFIGSIAFIAAARAAFIVTRDPDDPTRRLFVQAKNNLAGDSGGLAFRIEQRLVGNDVVPSAITWESERIARTADEILAANREGNETPERSEAAEFLRIAVGQGYTGSLDRRNLSLPIIKPSRIGEFPSPAGSRLVTRYRASDDYKGLAESTRRNWAPWLDRIASYFGELRIAQFDRPEKIRKVIRQWRNKWSTTPRTADYGMQVLSRVLAFAVDQGDIAGNPCKGIAQLYSNDRSEIIWTDANISTLKITCRAEVAYAVDLAAHSGLRLGDLLRLSWSHVGQDAIILSTGKSRGRREAIIPLYDGLREVLARIPKQSTTILTNSKQRPWRQTGFGTAFNRAKIRAGMHDSGFHFHDLCGTAATKFYLADLSKREIAAILAWSEDQVDRIIRRYVDRSAATKALIRRLNKSKDGT